MANQQRTLVYSIYLHDSIYGFNDMMIVESYDKAVDIVERFNNGNYRGIPYVDILNPQHCKSLDQKWMVRPVEVFGTSSVDSSSKLYPMVDERNYNMKKYQEMLIGLATWDIDVLNKHDNHVKIGFLFGRGIVNGWRWDDADEYPIFRLAGSVDDELLCSKKRKMI